MMRRKLVTIVAAVAMSTFLASASVLAETHSITKLTVTSGGGWKAVADGNTKVDGEQKAYVRITSRSNASIINAKVKRGSVLCTGEKSITKTNTRETIPYKSDKKVKKGDKMKIQFQATTQNQTLSGIWTS